MWRENNIRKIIKGSGHRKFLGYFINEYGEDLEKFLDPI